MAKTTEERICELVNLDREHKQIHHERTKGMSRIIDQAARDRHIARWREKERRNREQFDQAANEYYEQGH